MICYINRGLILEQLLVSAIADYFKTINLEGIYKNFHVNVTNSHPFADLLAYESEKTNDNFPAVIITTESEDKTSELMDLAPEVDAVGFDLARIEELTQNTEIIIKKGKEKQEKIPGYCNIIDSDAIETIKSVIEKQNYIYGIDIRNRRTDHVSIEIWAENNQLKNELYEQIRLFVTGNLRFILRNNKYLPYDIALFDSTISGQRSNNYNFDFSTTLCGARISFDVNYRVEQIVLDTEITGLNKDIIVEVNNHVKI